MQTSSILSGCSCWNSRCSLMQFRASHRVAGKNIHSRRKHSFSGALLCNSLRFRKRALDFTHAIVRISAAQEVLGTTSDSRFVETGYVFGVHGLQGEVKVKPNTDFPELRFSTPGTRWLKQQTSGTEALKEIELVEGRGRAGQNWIVKFNGINTVEQAQKLVGSTILVTDQDRPTLEEGEFYTHDLIGMKVILQESGEVIGTVAAVINSGASDLLHVELRSKNGAGDSCPLVWIPFVEAIVPIVVLEKNEIVITPPKGLLELNIPRHERSKKERRELEWKERKKFQRRLIAAKKKLCEMDQQHVFYGFRCGEKDQKDLLADQILSLNSRLLQQALQNMKISSASVDLFHILTSVPTSNILKLHDDHHAPVSKKHLKLQRGGCALMREGKVAVVLDVGETVKTSDTNLTSCANDSDLLLEKLHQGLLKHEDRYSVPLVLVCPRHLVNSIQGLFSDNDYFAFDPNKFWHFGEAVLPVIGGLEGENKDKILMKSPWEFLQTSIGTGGIISLILSQDSLFSQLSELGVEYIAVCKLTERCKNIHALAGLVASSKTAVGIRVYKDFEPEEDFNLLFSMSFLSKLMNQENKLLFEAVPHSSSFVKKVDKEWIDVVPVAQNSYKFHCSIYSCLGSIPSSNICVLDSS